MELDHSQASILIVPVCPGPTRCPQTHVCPATMRNPRNRPLSACWLPETCCPRPPQAYAVAAKVADTRSYINHSMWRHYDVPPYCTWCVSSLHDRLRRPAKSEAPPSRSVVWSLHVAVEVRRQRLVQRHWQVAQAPRAVQDTSLAICCSVAVQRVFLSVAAVEAYAALSAA